LGAAKNIRQFNQLKKPEKGKVCSVCGERVAKHYSNNNNKDIAKNEGLCHVCTAKRRYLVDNYKFPSTADIAMGHIVDLIKKDKTNANLLKPFEENGQLYYEENLNEKYFENNGINKAELDNCKEKLKEIKKIAKENGLKQTKYYALMAFDGDSMGSWLSGEYIKEGQLKEFHKELTKALGEFAKHVNDYLKEPYGCTIYAGGEDFIGFINLNYLFKVMAELRVKFKELVNDKLKKYFLRETLEISFSAGIAIAHYKLDLQHVVGQARRMEKLAKTGFGDSKNAFAITVLKSDTTETTWQWGQKNDKTIETITHLETILDQLKANFSSTYMATLYKEFEPLIDFKSGKLKGKKELGVFEFEIDRLVQRSFMGSQKQKESEAKKLIESLVFLFNATNSKKHTGYINNFFSMLETIDFLSKEVHV
jgi:CRISPR-associated protein Cmr2